MHANGRGQSLASETRNAGIFHERSGSSPFGYENRGRIRKPVVADWSISLDRKSCLLSFWQAGVGPKAGVGEASDFHY